MNTKRSSIILLLFLVGFLLGLGVDLYVPSLPAITECFATQAQLVQISVAVYMIGYGIAQLAFGPLSDALGRRKILLASSLAYTCISFAAALAPSIEALDALRFFQGICVAGLAVTTRALIVDCFVGPALSKSTTYFGLSWSLGPIVGPCIGAYLQQAFGWQANFYFFALYGLCCTLFIFHQIPETLPQRLPLSVVPLLRSAATILRDSRFVTITLIGSFVYSLIVIFNIAGPFLLQNELHYSATEYGHIALTLGIAYCCGSIANRLLLNRYTPMAILAVALPLSALVSLFMLPSAWIASLTLMPLLVPVMIHLFLCGFIVPCSLAEAMSLFPGSAGSASSLFGALSGAIVGLTALLGSSLKTASAVTLSLLYLALSLINLVLFFQARKHRDIPLPLATNSRFATCKNK